MAETNGKSASPTRVVARNMAELAHDTITIAELQTRLFQIEAREWSRGLIPPIVLLVVAVCVALGCVPVLLLLLASALNEYVNLSPTASIGLASVVGLLIVGICALAAYVMLRRNRRPLDRTRQEFQRNVRWLKQVLKHGSAPRRERARDG